MIDISFFVLFQDVSPGVTNVPSMKTIHIALCASTVWMVMLLTMEIAWVRLMMEKISYKAMINSVVLLLSGYILCRSNHCNY